MFYLGSIPTNIYVQRIFKYKYESMTFDEPSKRMKNLKKQNIFVFDT